MRQKKNAKFNRKFLTMFTKAHKHHTFFLCFDFYGFFYRLFCILFGKKHIQEYKIQSKADSKLRISQKTSFCMRVNIKLVFA